MRLLVESHKKTLVILIALLGVLMLARNVFEIPAFRYDVQYTGHVLK
jgi:hypothetical protein